MHILSTLSQCHILSTLSQCHILITLSQCHILSTLSQCHILSTLSQCHIIVGNKVILRAYIMNSEMPYFLVRSLCIKRLVHLAVYCISWSCLLFFYYAIPIIPFLIYEIFSLSIAVSGHGTRERSEAVAVTHNPDSQ